MEDAYAQERELISQKLDNIMDYFDALNEYQQAILNKLDAQMKVDTAKGYGTDINKLLKEYGTERETYQNSAKRDQEYEDEAERTIEAINKSYQDQLNDAQNNIKDTATYQKLKDKNKKGKINVKQALVGEYQVLAEDAEAAKGWLDKLNKTLDKKGNVKKGKQAKYDEAKAELERLHKKYTDYIEDLSKEQEEAIDDAKRNLEKQQKQNEADTIETEADYWTRLKEVLDAVAHVYDVQIEKLEAVIDQYDILADTLKDIDDETIAAFGVTDIFGTSDQRSDYIKKSLAESKKLVNLYHQQYNIYAKLVDAAQTKDINKFEDILNNSNIDSDLKNVVQDLLNQLAAGINLDMSNYEATWQQSANSVISNINQIMKKGKEASDEIADAVTEAVQKVIDALKFLQDAYTTRASLIDEDWAIDVNGITEYGYAQVAEIAQAINVAQQRLDKSKEKLAALEKEYMKPDTDMTDETYRERQYAAIAEQEGFKKDIQSMQKQINDLAKKAAQNELTQLQKLVDAYKKALNAKKSYYDYDKTLREKNKNIESIKAEIAALSNIGDAAAKARLKSLQAELDEAQEDLDDTVFNHQITVENEVLDNLVADLTQQLDDSTKTFREKMDEFNNNVTSLIDRSSTINVDELYQKIESELMKKYNLNPTAELDIETQINDKNKIAYDKKVSEVSAKQTEINNLKSQIEELQGKATSAQRFYNTQKQNAKLRSNLAKKKKAAEEATAKLDSKFVIIDGQHVLKANANEYSSILAQIAKNNESDVVKKKGHEKSTGSYDDLGVIDKKKKGGTSNTDKDLDIVSLQKRLNEIISSSDQQYVAISKPIKEYNTAYEAYNKELKSRYDTWQGYLKEIAELNKKVASAEKDLSNLTKDAEDLSKKVNESTKSTKTSASKKSSSKATTKTAQKTVEETTSSAPVLQASSVSSDIQNGVLSDLSTSTLDMSNQLLSTLAEIKDFKSIVNFDNDFLPTISKHVTFIAADVNSISKNTETITDQLSKMQDTLTNINTNAGTVIVNSGISIDDLKQLGLKRTYK